MRKVLGWVSGKLNDGTSAIGRVILTRYLRKWADGDLGEFPTRVYFALQRNAGKIAWTLGTLTMCLVIAAQWPDLLELVGLSAAAVGVWGERLAYIEPLLVSIKLSTDQWNSVQRPAWLDKPFPRWLAAHGTINTLVFTTLWGIAKDCGAGGWCDVERWALFVLGVAAAHFRFIDRSARALPPNQVLAALAGAATAPTPKVAAEVKVIEAHPEANELQKDVASALSIHETTSQKVMAKSIVEDVGRILTKR